MFVNRGSCGSCESPDPVDGLSLLCKILLEGLLERLVDSVTLRIFPPDRILFRIRDEKG